jgi:hypothetical protein
LSKGAQSRTQALGSSAPRAVLTPALRIYDAPF